MRAYERLLNYVKFDTASCESNDCCPSTPGQLVLARALADEMLSMGLSNVRPDGHGYLYGEIPATAEGFPTIGLIAHMDTVDCVPSAPVNARIVENYDGGDVLLDGGETLSPADYPELLSRVGKDLIVTDGRTLLGADDKAGIAEILTACETLLKGDRPHGRVVIGFTPDEEIGRGADLFDVKGFGADFAYTVDGDAIGSIEYENFNAAALTLHCHGRSVHPGDAKGKMINAALVAMEFNAMLPAAERPEHTEGREGFFCLCDIQGETESATAHYIIRDHDRTHFEARKELVRQAAAYLNLRYGAGTVEAELKDSYYNMLEVIAPHMHIVHRAEAAWAAAGVTPFTKPIRGGTDGARLSFEGLPCPNLGTGGMNYHGRFECIAVQDMDIAANMLAELVCIKTI